MLAVVLALLVLGFALSAPSTWLLCRLGRRLGALDGPGARGQVKEIRPVPNVGGIAIFWSVVGPLAAGLALVVAAGDEVGSWLPAIAPHLGRIEAAWSDWAVILAGAAVLHAMGIVDDRRALSAWPKLAIQVGVALATAWWSDVRLLEQALSAFPGGTALSILLTVAWIVVVVNAVNFIDNMDGLAGGIAAIAAACFMAATILNGQWFIAAALALLVGALVGFLVWNLPPARIFMGDGGSLFVGYLLATLTVRTTYVDVARPDYALGSAWYGMFMPLVVLAVPLYDGVYVTIWRLLKGRSPFVGGPEHVSHRLVELGLSRRRAVLVLWLLTATTASGGIGLGLMKPWQAALVGAQVLGIFLVLVVLETSVARPRQGPGNGPGARG